MNRSTHMLLPLLLSLWAVRAEAAKVVIVRPAGASPDLNETLSRIQGEVLSLGFEVAIAERPAPSDADSSDSRSWIERMARERDTDAVIDVIGDAAPAAVDVWVFERQPRRSEVSRVAREPNAENPAERLAIRAVEALRSSLVEIDLTAQGQRAPIVAPPPLATVSQVAPREPRDLGVQFDLQAGAAVLTSLDGVGPALMPVVRAGWTATSWLVLQGELAGFGSRATVASMAGNARVGQQYAVLGGCACARSARVLQPYVALSGGVLRTTIDGEAVTPASGHFAERWSFLLDGSLGARLRLPGRYHLTLAAHVQVAEPYVAIHFVDMLVATSGHPTLGLSLTVGAWL